MTNKLKYNELVISVCPLLGAKICYTENLGLVTRLMRVTVNALLTVIPRFELYGIAHLHLHKGQDEVMVRTQDPVGSSLGYLRRLLHILFMNVLCMEGPHLSTECTQLILRSLVSFKRDSAPWLMLGHITRAPTITGSTTIDLPGHLRLAASRNLGLS